MSSLARQNFVINLRNTKPTLWSVQYIFALLVNLFVSITGFILITILPLFSTTLGGNNFIAGLLTTLLTLSALVCRPICGKLLDEYGRKVVLIVGLALFSVPALLYASSSNLAMMLILRFLQGVGLSAYSTALGTIVSDIVPESRISEGVGYYNISGTISMAVGPTIGLFLQKSYGYQVTYLAAFLITILSIIIACFINYESRNGISKFSNKELMATGSGNYDKQNGKTNSFVEQTALRTCIVMIFSVLAVSAVFSFMPLFGEERNIDNIGLFFTFYAVSMIVTRILTGKIADQYGYIKVIIPSIAITLLLFITLIYAYSLPMVLLAAIFYGVGYGTLQPVLNAVVIKLSPVERRGAANATFFATLDIGFGLGSFIWGGVSQVAGFTVVFIGCAACIVASLLAFYFILRGQLIGI